MKLGVLGPLAVWDDTGEKLDLGSPNQRRLLTVLASRAGQAVGNDTLIDAIWGPDAPPSALRSLRTYVSRLRTTLAGAGGGGAIETTGDGYRLCLPAADIDSGRFESLVAEESDSRRPRPEPLRAALALWRGRPFPDAADTPMVEAEARRLEELRDATREKLSGALLEAGRADESVALAESLVAEEPLREGAWCVLVAALAASGRQADALRAYQRAAAGLADAGLEPSLALREAEAAVLRGDSEATATEPPGSTGDRGASGGQPAAMPRPLHELVGREHDLEAVDALLGRARAVTIIGPGGVGKTRLATEVARAAGRGFADGCTYVELAPVTSGDDVAATIVDALGLTVDAEGVDEALANAGSLEALFVLDNCEHLLDAVAGAVETMLSGGAAARVLATSRERLGVDGEHAWALRPLPVSGEGNAARELFLERARASAPELALVGDAPDDPLGESVDRIVARLDGLPLAIEMAAARMSSTGPDELLELLDEHLVLRSSRRHVEARHRTMDAVIEWSTSMLTEEERTALDELAVFAGPADRVDIEAVTDRTTAVDLVPALADRSLVVVERDEHSVRYGMLQTVRSHVRSSQRWDCAGTSARHARHHAGKLAGIDAAMRTVEEPQAVDHLEACYAELSGAIRWALANETATAAAMLGDLHLAARNQLRHQPLSWAQEALGVLRGDEPRYGDVLASAVERQVHLGNLAEAEGLARRAASLDPVSPMTLELFADVLGYLGRHGEAAGVARRQMDLAESLDDEHGMYMASVNLVLSELYGGDVGAAREGLPAVPPAAGSAPSVRGWLEYVTGEVCLHDDPPSARSHLHRAIEAADSVDNRFLGGVARVAMASWLAHSGTPRDAVDTFGSIVSYWRRHGVRTQLATTLRHLVVLLARLGAEDAAAELLGSVRPDAERPSTGDEARRLDDAASTLSEHLGEDRFESLVAAGADVSLDDAAGRALAVLTGMEGPGSGLGRVGGGEGGPPQLRGDLGTDT